MEFLDRLWTKHAIRGCHVGRWGSDRFRTMASDCLRVIQRLEPETATEVRNIEDVLQELG